MTDPTDLLFIDTETTGVHRGARVWSVTAATLDGDVLSASWSTFDQHAEDYALALSRYWSTPKIDPRTVDDVVARLASRTTGAILAGASVHFDRRVLDGLFRHHRVSPAWSHRVLDVTTYLAGACGQPGPVSLRAAAQLVGLDYDRELAHGAAYDTWLALTIYGHVAEVDTPPYAVFAAAAAASGGRWEYAGDWSSDPVDPPLDELPAHAAEVAS